MAAGRVGQPDIDLAKLLSLLADDLTRRILSQLAEDALTVQEIGERFDVSNRTVYRRLDDLQEHDLVDEATQMSDQGHLYSRYHTPIEHIDIDIDPVEDEVDVDLTYSDDVDGFIDLWGGLGGQTQSEE